MAPPKPRKQLVKAHAAAVKWAENNPESIAAKKNLAYVNSRISELGWTKPDRGPPRLVVGERNVGGGLESKVPTPLGKPRGERKQLAVALAAAEKSAFGKLGGKPPRTKKPWELGPLEMFDRNFIEDIGSIIGDDADLSAEQLGAKHGWDEERIGALKNYMSVKERIRETGGDLTGKEKGWYRNWRKARLDLPAPNLQRYGPRMPGLSERADDLRREVREANLARGARPTGGPGRAEVKQAGDALAAAFKDGKLSQKAVEDQLRKAGYRVTGELEDTKKKLQQYTTELGRGERAGWTAASQNPFDIERNTKLIGKPAATTMYGVAAKEAPELDPMRPPVAGKDWATRGTESAYAGLAKDPLIAGLGELIPWTHTVSEDVKELTVGSLLGVPALAETTYNDFTGKTRNGLAKLLMEGGKEFVRIVEAGIPLEPFTLAKAGMTVATTGDVKAGLDVIVEDAKQAGKQWSEHPATTLINVLPGANIAARGISIPMLAARMARLNPDLTPAQALNAARKESYVPGWAKRQGIEGGIPDRILKAKIFDDEGNLLKETPVKGPGWSRTPVGRGGQKLGAALGKEWTLPSGRKVNLGPLSETARAATALKRQRNNNWERQRVRAVQAMNPIISYIKRSNIPRPLKEKYVNTFAEHRTRLVETFFGGQGPSDISVEDMLTAVKDDLRAIKDEGVLNIPTVRIAKLDKELDKLDREFRKMGIEIDTSSGRWAEAQDMMRDAGYDETLIDLNLEMMKGRARVWANARDDRLPEEWIDSPDGRDLAGFVYGMPDVDVADDLDIAASEGPLTLRAPEAAPQTLYQAISGIAGAWAQRARGLEKPRRAGAHIPDVRLPGERVAGNVKAKQSGKSKATGIPDTPVLRTSLDGGPEFQISGDVTPEAWVERVLAVISDPVARDNLARWYEHYVPMFRRAFGKDANAIMRGFAVSQANASPASGLSAVLRVMDGVREGKEIGKKGYGSVVSENIGKAVRDGQIDSFLAAKLTDFINSLEGRSTRQWMGDNPDLGMPAAVDVHAIRDRGFIDKKLIARMRNVHGYEVGQDYIIEGTGAASGGKYEKIAEWYGEIAKHLNEIDFDGRSDWTPAQAQALGWSAIQLAHKTVPEGFAEAFAYNTRAITFEVTKGPGELGVNLDLKASTKAARTMLREAKELAKDIPGLYLTSASVGHGGWNQGYNANITVRVMGSKAQVQKALTTFAQAFDQEWVQATREVSGANSRATLVIDSPKFKNPQTAAKFFAALNRINPKLEGSMDYDVDGTPGMAIRTSSPSVSPKTQAAFLKRHKAAVDQASAETGIDVGLGVRNVEMLTGGQHGDVAPVQTLPGSGRGLSRAELDDPSAARVRARLEEVLGGGAAARPARTPEAQEVAAPRTLYQADQPLPGEMKGYETRIPVLVERETGEVHWGQPGDMHATIIHTLSDQGVGGVTRKGEIDWAYIEGHFDQEQVMIDPTDGKVLHTPREVDRADAQARVDAYLDKHYPHGVGGKGPRVPEDATIERWDLARNDEEWAGSQRTPWIYDVDSGILHIGSPGSDHLAIMRAVADKYGYNESLNRAWNGVWAPSSQRVVLHGNETGDMPSEDFPLDPRLGPVIQEAFGKKLKQWDPETGEIQDMPEDTGMIGAVRGGVMGQEGPEPGDVVGGAVQWLDTIGGRQLLFLTDKANPSTFLHEMFGHAAHEMKREYPEAFAAVEKRYKKAYEDWTRDEHERFAREVERYFRSGKAPIPELQPVFDQLKAWMKTVYESIKALGRPLTPETKQLLDQYFGKEALDFTPPQRVRRSGKNAFPDPKDANGVQRLVTRTSELLSRGPTVLREDPADRSIIAGNMKWIEEQVLPFADSDPALAAKVDDLFKQFEEVKAGGSIFTPGQAAAIKRYGNVINLRGKEIAKSQTRLAAQPDPVKIEMAGQVMEELDDPDLTLEGLEAASSDLRDLSYELLDQKTKFDDMRTKLLTRQIKDIERALDPRRSVATKEQRDQALAALREISELNERILVDVFGEGLSPEDLATLKDSLARRADILTRRLKEQGLLPESAGPGYYQPHYSLYDVLHSKIRDAVKLPAAGRNRKTLSMNVKKEPTAFPKGGNRLIRYQTGELAITPQGLLSQYMQRMRFVETKLLRQELYDIGVEIPRSGRVPQGWYIINGSGEAVPNRIKALRDMSDEQIDELLASGEDFDAQISSESGVIKSLKEYRDNFLYESEHGDVPGDWTKNKDKMRMVPPEIVEKMVGRVFKEAPNGRFAATTAMAALMARFATIYAHVPGYIGANVAANTVMLAATKPSSLARGLLMFSKVAPSLRSSHPELYERIAVETGDALAQAGLPDFYIKEQNRFQALERKGTAFSQRWATGLGDIADQPFRVASWVGEARREGFTNPEDWERLIDPNNLELEDVRNRISQRSRENMIDFNKLTEAEKLASRWLFIWPFLRGSMKWPFWYLSEYPGRAAAIAGISGAQEEAYEGTGVESVRERYDRMAPISERTMFDMFQVPLPGDRGNINLAPINPIGAFTEKVDEFGRLLHGDVRVLGDILNPAFRTGGAQIFGDRGFDAKALAEVTVPWYSYYRAATEPKKRGAQVYTDRDSFWDYIRRREGRFWPEDVDYEKVKEAKKKELEKADQRKSWEKDQEQDYKNVDKILEHIRSKGGTVGPKSAGQDQEVRPLLQQAGRGRGRHERGARRRGVDRAPEGGVHDGDREGVRPLPQQPALAREARDVPRQVTRRQALEGEVPQPAARPHPALALEVLHRRA